MKCKVCGNESGKYPLCRACNEKKEKGEIIKCDTCKNWHYKDAECSQPEAISTDKYLYEIKKDFISKAEQGFFNAIKEAIPEGYFVFPQINLATIVERTDNQRFHNELFRNIDFLVTDNQYIPKIAIEINDQTHLTNDRHERDEKVQKILEEAGIPLLKLWTSYGVKPDYIKEKITEMLNSPISRKHNFPFTDKTSSKKQDDGCYIATCVYGSYDCPQVWTLRRYRDNILAHNWYGRLFIKFYYLVSPKIVKLFGQKKWFNTIFRYKLDKMVFNLKNAGIESTPYKDKNRL
ncbi:MAG: DUF2726 domain-containing protein [Clostridia bacterium]|nr:DUF2726 domain-containing protein [Clostridia bacterium]